MEYNFAPFGGIWQNGIFNVPNDIVDKYLKIASEYQLKALLFVLKNGGKASSAQIAKVLGQTVSDIEDLMELWVEDGILSPDNRQAVKPKEEKAEEKSQEVNVVKEALPVPRLTPKDIVNASMQSEEIEFLLNEAQVILGRTLSHSDREMLVNMVNYYGLKVEVIMMILQFYRNEKEKGNSINVAYVNAMAKNWAEEGIDSIADAEAKLQEIEKSDRRWKEVTALTGIRHKRPTIKQREMVNGWFEDFDITMITLACDIMKENTSAPTLAYVNSVLKKWKKKGITIPAQVEEDQKAFSKSKADKKSDKLKSEPTYDLDEYKKFAQSNTDI